jgi:AraC-like DNA-binding protein
LTHYPGAGAQTAHAHDFTQLSFLIGGRMSERLEGRDHDLLAPAIGYKPAGALHADRWGAEGVLIFSISLDDASRSDVRFRREAGWSRLAPHLPMAAIVRACFGGPETIRRDAIEDALALSSFERDTPGATPPPWLQSARQSLTDEPEMNVETAASLAGVDRAHLSRAFQRCYGIPPSVHRRRMLTARAVAAIARSEAPLGRLAHEAGFSDHAHMCRALRSDIGLMATELRDLLKGEITSVQDHVGSAG